MAQINVNIRMDSEVKEKADQLFLDLGLTLTVAVNAFIKHALEVEGIPFEIKRKQKHIPLKERMKDYQGDHRFEEWDTGPPVGKEVF